MEKVTKLVCENMEKMTKILLDFMEKVTKLMCEIIEKVTKNFVIQNKSVLLHRDKNNEIC